MQENKCKIKDTSYLYGVLPQANPKLTVRDCIPATASMPFVVCVVVVARCSFVPFVVPPTAAIGPYPAREC
jgi:hypothetical protein